MAEQQPQRTLTLAQIDGRITELEAQRNAAQARCAILAGEKAEAVDLLRQCQEEIARLNGIVNDGASFAPSEPSGPALN